MNNENPNSSSLWYCTFLPMIFCLSLHFVFSGVIGNLPFGLVNYEVSSGQECQNESLMTIETNGYDCLVSKASCRFSNEIRDNEMTMVIFEVLYEISMIKQFLLQTLYDTYEEAYEDTRRGRINGFIFFSSNFTDAMPLLNDDFEHDLSNNGLVQVTLDQTDFIEITFIKQKLYDTLQRYSINLMTACKKSKKSRNVAIAI
jgi:hypothetical protein